MIIISIINNKGGVGKTTYLFHLANILADHNKTVLMVDCDSQCNLTAYSVDEEVIKYAWDEEGNSIYKVLEKVSIGMGDIEQKVPTKIRDYLYLVPGDVDLSRFEDRLGDTWSSVNSEEISLRTQIAIYRYILYAAQTIKADYVLIDMGPNLGALNRSVLGGCDYFITPLSPDLFSIKGTQNLGDKLVKWSKEWVNIIKTWSSETALELPSGKPKFLGYVIQEHNMRNTKSGMTKAWQIFGKEVDESVNRNIIQKLKPLCQVVEKETYTLGQIPNLHSLIPYSQNAHKPVYKCDYKDGLKGDHITKAKESIHLFDDIVTILDNIK